MKITRRFLLTAVGAAVLVAGMPVANAADRLKVAIGQKGLWDTMVTVHGQEQGFFADEGLEVEVIWTKGGSETLQAVVTGSVQFAMANGILGVLGAYDKGAPVRIVGAQMTGAPDLFWYARSDSGIDGLKQAEGKTMGFSREGSSTHLVALALTDAAGVKASLTPTGGISGTRTQVQSGQIDVGWSVPPFNLDLVKKGDIKIIARGSDLASLADQTVRVNVVNADFLAENRDAVERFMRAYARAIDWMYDNQEEAIKSYAAFNDIDVEVARDAVEFYPKESMAIAPVKGIDHSIKQAIEYGRLPSPLNAEAVEELLQIVHQPGSN